MQLSCDKRVTSSLIDLEGADDIGLCVGSSVTYRKLGRGCGVTARAADFGNVEPRSSLGASSTPCDSGQITSSPRASKNVTLCNATCAHVKRSNPFGSRPRYTVLQKRPLPLQNVVMCPDTPITLKTFEGF